MNKIFQVRVVSADRELLVRSTSVYANSLLEAKVAGAEQLGVSVDQVVAEEIPGVGNPTDDQLREMWRGN